MENSDPINSNKLLHYELSNLTKGTSPCSDIMNISIIVHKKMKSKKRKKTPLLNNSEQPTIAFRLSRYSILTPATRHYSVPDIKKKSRLVYSRAESFNSIHKQIKKLNVASGLFFNECMNPCNLTYSNKPKWKIYRCQLNNSKESCCCSCNSETMFEGMTSLYEFCKNNNCGNCDCILYGDLTRAEKTEEAVVAVEFETARLNKKREKAREELESKNLTQKENILRETAKDKTPSKKTSNKKIRDKPIVSEEPKTTDDKDKMRITDAADIIPPKRAAQKDIKTKMQVALDLPLPEERKLYKITTRTGIPSNKLHKANNLGLITALEGKCHKQKKTLLKRLTQHSVSLPEGKPKSKEMMIYNIRNRFDLPPESKNSATKDQYTNNANGGSLQPLECKSPKEGEISLHQLNKFLFPMEKKYAMSADTEQVESLEEKTPAKKKKIFQKEKSRTQLEKSLINQILLNESSKTGPFPKRSSEMIKAAKAAALLITFEGKTQTEIEKIIRGLAKLGITLHEGKKSSEKISIHKVRANMSLSLRQKNPTHTTTTQIKYKSRTQRQKNLRGKRTLRFPYLESNILQEKEKKCQGLAKQDLPQPKGKSATKNYFATKFRMLLGLPPAPKVSSEKERYVNKAAALSLEDLSSIAKERILRAQPYLGRTSSEIRASSGNIIIAEAEPKTPIKTQSKIIRKANEGDSLTSLERNTQNVDTEAEKKVIIASTEQNLRIPKPVTASEKKLIAKIRKELGLSPASKTLSEKEKRNKICTLEGFHSTDKEKIQKIQPTLSLNLSNERTPSKNELIAKTEDDKLARSEKLQKSIFARLLTALETNAPTEKEIITKGLVKTRLPSPESKTPYEKSLIQKIRKNDKIGMLVSTKTSSETIPFLPISSKSLAEQEKILQELSKARLPLPVGKITSVKAGLPLTLAEKMKNQENEKEHGLKDIFGTKTCNRGSGCVSKIKLKHNYIITSPDIPSLCNCPEECIPIVKDRGIKVIVGRATCTPLHPRNLKTVTDATLANILENYLNNTSNYNLHDHVRFVNSDYADFEVNTSSSNGSCSSDASHSPMPYSTASDSNYQQNTTPPYEGRTSETHRLNETLRCSQSSGDIHRVLPPDGNSFRSSFGTIRVIKSETSLSLTTSATNSSDSINVMSVEDSRDTFNSTHHSSNQLADTTSSISSTEAKSNNGFVHNTAASSDTITSRYIGSVSRMWKQGENMIFRMSQTDFSTVDKNKKNFENKRMQKKVNPKAIINNAAMKIVMKRLLKKKQFSNATSIFIVIPSDDNDEDSNSPDSATNIQSTENTSKMNTTTEYPDKAQGNDVSARTSVKVCGKGKKFYMREISLFSLHDKENTINKQNIKIIKGKEKKIDKVCQTNTICQTTERKMDKKSKDNVTECIKDGPCRCFTECTDTTEDRPCCCCCENESVSNIFLPNKISKEHFKAKIISKQVMPISLKQGRIRDWFKFSKRRPHSQESCLSTKSSSISMPCDVPPCLRRDRHKQYPESSQMYDASQMHTNADTTEMNRYPNASKMNTDFDSSQMYGHHNVPQTQTNPGTSEIYRHPDASEMYRNPDASKMYRYPDASDMYGNPKSSQMYGYDGAHQKHTDISTSKMYKYPDASETYEDADVCHGYHDRSKTQTYPDTSQQYRYPNVYQKYKYQDTPERRAGINTSQKYKYPSSSQGPPPCYCCKTKNKLKELLEEAISVHKILASRCCGMSNEVSTVESGVGHPLICRRSASKEGFVTCSDHVHTDELECQCFDEEGTFFELCSCQPPDSESGTQFGPKYGTRSTGIITDLRGEIQSVSKNTIGTDSDITQVTFVNQIKAADIHSQKITKKTRFGFVTEKVCSPDSSFIDVTDSSNTTRDSPNTTIERSIGPNVFSSTSQTYNTNDNIIVADENGETNFMLREIYSNESTDQTSLSNKLTVQETTISPKELMETQSQTDPIPKELRETQSQTDPITKELGKTQSQIGYIKTQIDNNPNNPNANSLINQTEPDKKEAQSQTDVMKAHIDTLNQAKHNNPESFINQMEADKKETQNQSDTMKAQTSPNKLINLTKLAVDQRQMETPGKLHQLKRQTRLLSLKEMWSSISKTKSSVNPDSPSTETKDTTKERTCITCDAGTSSEELFFPRLLFFEDGKSPCEGKTAGLGFPYEAIQPCCAWEDTGEVMRMRSVLSQTVSGFKVLQPKKAKRVRIASQENITYDFADAIRYFAKINPEKFHELMEQQQGEKRLEVKPNKGIVCLLKLKKMLKRETINDAKSCDLYEEGGLKISVKPQL